LKIDFLARFLPDNFKNHDALNFNPPLAIAFSLQAKSQVIEKFLARRSTNNTLLCLKM
jgi:hypothetical protein